MNSPFPPSSSSPGKGQLNVQLLPFGVSALSKMTFQYPLKLISPSPSAEQKSVLVFLLTYGGGLVGGDQVHLTISVEPHSKLSLVTQGHTKIFKSPTREVVTRQRMDVRIEDGAGLCLLPDPVQPFEKSVYEQHQIFTLMDSASLCLLDWVSAGRTARGENWDLWGWMGKNEIWSAAAAERKARLLLRDNVMLKSDAAESHQNLLRAKMHKLDIFGTLILRGPMLDSLAAFFLKEFSELPRIGGRDFRSHDAKDREKDKLVSQSENWRTARLQQEKDGGVLWSVARVRSCIVVKFGARTVEDGRTWIGSMIKHDGSIVETFGEDAVMCVK